MNCLVKIWLFLIFSNWFLACNAANIINYTDANCHFHYTTHEKFYDAVHPYLSSVHYSKDSEGYVLPPIPRLHQVDLKKHLPNRYDGSGPLLSVIVTCDPGGTIELFTSPDSPNMPYVISHMEKGLFQYDLYVYGQQQLFILPAHYFDREPPRLTRKDTIVGFFSVRDQLKPIYRHA